MLEKIDLTKKMDKTEYRERMEALEPELGRLQRECKERRIPVMIVFEGYGASGKGEQIAALIHSLDPRGFTVYPVKNETEEERMHPYLWRFWTKLPAAGQIALYDSSWYRRVLNDRFDHKTEERKVQEAYDSILAFERQLTDGGMVLIKFFLDIDRKEQKKRMKKLLESETTAWRVSREDLRRNEGFEEYQKMNEEMLLKTDTGYAPWNVIEAVDRRYATVKIYTLAAEALKAAIRKADAPKEEEASAPRYMPSVAELQESTLSRVDLSVSMDRETYRKKKKKLQEKLERLHSELYRRRIPVVLGFEGWDAGGKGGAIKRLTECMDPRGYVVNPTASPNEMERAYHYLWRFWKAMPKAGHIAVFDRTWYGRVMVERIEGFCSEQEWQRAYREINEMEQDLARDGAIVLKFWMQIDKDEQERRFHARENDPDKQWKITEEDWRNRAKWEQYEEAVNEMLIRTSTPYAPWIVVEGNCKYYARIKVLETVVGALERRMKQE